MSSEELECDVSSWSCQMDPSQIRRPPFWRECNGAGLRTGFWSAHHLALHQSCSCSTMALGWP